MFNRNNLLTEQSFTELRDDEKLKYLVFFAGMAPSSHNTQPWLFKCAGQTIELFAAWQRKLTASDQSGRELYLSLGAAWGNILMAADSLGLKYKTETNFAAENKNNPVARIFFESLNPSKYNIKQLEAVLGRHCNRFDFDDTAIPKDTQKNLIDLAVGEVKANILSTPEQKKAAQIIVEKATVDAFKDKGFTDELSLWIKPSLKKYKDGMPGYNIGIPWILSFFMPWAIRHLPLSQSQGKMTGKTVHASQILMVLSTVNDNPKAWFECGEVFERTAVAAQKENLQLSVLAAPVEIKDYYRQLQELLGINERPQMFFRLGYCKKIPAVAPRLPLTQIIL